MIPIYPKSWRYNESSVSGRIFHGTKDFRAIICIDLIVTAVNTQGHVDRAGQFTYPHFSSLSS